MILVIFRVYDDTELGRVDVIGDYYFIFLDFLLVTINLSDRLRFLLVFIPGSTTFPLNIFLCFLPCPLCDSHHPCGWSTGFAFNPISLPFLPIRRVFPAFPHTVSLWSSLLTVPMVARHVSWNFLTSPEGILINTSHSASSFHDMVANVPADLISFPLV